MDPGSGGLPPADSRSVEHKGFIGHDDRDRPGAAACISPSRLAALLLRAKAHLHTEVVSNPDVDGGLRCDRRHANHSAAMLRAARGPPVARLFVELEPNGRRLTSSYQHGTREVNVDRDVKRWGTAGAVDSQSGRPPTRRSLLGWVCGFALGIGLCESTDSSENSHGRNVSPASSVGSSAGS